MTKKSKKKAVKTGYRSADAPRSTTVNVGYSATFPTNKRPLNLDNDHPDENHHQRKFVSKFERKRIERLKKEELLAQYKIENEARSVYPVDVWFLIGRFVEPEHVKRFSMICRGSYHVTCSKQFWLDLYKRFVTEHKGLPSHLQPNAISTNVGLRARVVRALHHVYSPFKVKTLHQVPLAESPSIVEDLMVESHWWRRLVSSKQFYVWRLYMKLVQINKHHNGSNSCGGGSNGSYFAHHQEKRNKKSIFSVTKLLSHNPEDAYKLLQVTSSSYVQVPNVFGMCLTEVSTSVSRDMKGHKVRLHFHEYRRYRRYNNSQATILTVDPAFDVQVLNWWDAEYPHPFDT